MADPAGPGGPPEADNRMIFDPVRAAREELAGLSDVQRALAARERHAEEALSLAESELSAIRKITGYVRISMDVIRARIQELENPGQAP